MPISIFCFFKFLFCSVLFFLPAILSTHSHDLCLPPKTVKKKKCPHTTYFRLRSVFIDAHRTFRPSQVYLPPTCSIFLLLTPMFLFLSFSWTAQMIRACCLSHSLSLSFFFLQSKNIPDHVLINSTCHRMVRALLIYFPYPPPLHSPSVHCSLFFSSSFCVPSTLPCPRTLPIHPFRMALSFF